MRAYAEVIPYPAGSIVGQELFQTGVIPSDTDYRIFKDFGEELPGNAVIIKQTCPCIMQRFLKDIKMLIFR